MAAKKDENDGANDKIFVTGMIFHGYHGVHPEEKKLGQKFCVDVEASVDLRRAGETGHLEDTVSYSDLYRVVKKIVEGPPHDLLESVAHQISKSLFQELTAIRRLRIRITKPGAPIKGIFQTAGIEIYRSAP
eukprot:TRINITY_DN5936_c0_g1_i2.p1 TRINITY_DN5936_c0_g1~~TRINITY_DN5936_c0_g1_i2.p1  ORF type:complete len:152 (+),score=29.34 TRINITY_DN5936_c0_g1_i2:63-458(+)